MTGKLATALVQYVHAHPAAEIAGIKAQYSVSTIRQGHTNQSVAHCFHVGRTNFTHHGLQGGTRIALASVG